MSSSQNTTVEKKVESKVTVIDVPKGTRHSFGDVDCVTISTKRNPPQTTIINHDGSIIVVNGPCNFGTVNCVTFNF